MAPRTRTVPRVVFLIGNDVEVDARVRKYLRSTVAAGLDVIVLGLSSSGQDDEITIEGARAIRRVPVAAGPAPAGRPSPAQARTLRARVARKLRSGSWPRALRPPDRLVPAALSRDRQLELYLRKPELARWRQVLPELETYEATFGPLLDELDADLLHPHDVFLLGVAVRAAERSRHRGHPVPLVYDAREYLPGLPNPPARTTAAYVDHEREYLPAVDRVITVSDPIADELQRSFALTHRPSLVLNAPIIDPPEADPPSVRTAAGITDDAPIVLYGGGLAQPRGVHTVVDALPLLPGVHLVVVSRAPSHYTRELQARASELGCADRYHEVGFVEPTQVVRYFSSATVGIVPLLHAGNHDWALTNKFFEYVHAGLPVVTSDTEVQDRLVRELGIGEVFVAGDVDGCAQALRRVLDQLDRYRAPLADLELLRRFSWQAQADILLDLYRELLGPLPVDGPAQGAEDGTLVEPTSSNPRET